MTNSPTHTVIFGLGITGYSCLRFLRHTDRLTIVDTRQTPPFLAQTRSEFPDVRLILGAAKEDDLASADRIVVSPGLPLTHCLLGRAKSIGIPLVSDIELFLQHAKAPVIGVTGTNGKSTVTALTGEILRAAKLNVGVGGNLGEPALDLLEDGRDVYVLELSSFQLERLVAGRFAIAANLNVSPDHLDRYPDVASYAASKQRIFAGCDVAVFNRADPLTVPGHDVASRRVTVGLDAPPADGWGIVERGGVRHLAHGTPHGTPHGTTPLLPVHELGIHGRHNEFNALTALALAHEARGTGAYSARTLREFKGLEHRCQTVAVIDGITFINDSKATNIGACVAALEGLGDARRHIVLIAGGDAKKADLSPLRDVVGKFVHDVVTLGKDAVLVEAAVAGVAAVQRATSMSEAVRMCRSVARPGDLVLLSPACASLDMYTNFEARGREFARAVLETAS